MMLFILFMVKVSGGLAYGLPLTPENNYMPNLDEVAVQLEKDGLSMKRVKALIINYPNNPLGAVCTLDYMKHAVEFCKKHNKKIRWHTLVWHAQMPKWIYYQDKECKELATKEMLEARIKKYIFAVMEHTKDYVSSYDVVNEPISDKTYKLRTEEDHSFWQKILGPDYVEKMFTWAHEANPDAELVINDYNIESTIGKREGMYNFVKEMLAKNVPISAVGLQMHISVNDPPVEQIEETINMFGELGLKVLVTEMDVSVYKFEDKERIEYTPELLEKQAQRYKEIFECFKRCAKKGYLTDVVLWGTMDSRSWKNDFPVPGRTDIPLLFDGNGKAKPAFYSITKE